MRQLLFILCFIAIGQMTAQAQSKKTSSDNEITHIDKAGIEAAVLGYIENFFENNTEEMIKHLHPQLAKGGVSKKRGEEVYFYEAMSIDQLKELMASKPALPKEQQDNEVIILDVFRNTASVRLETGYPNRMRWIEYIILSKTDDQWLVNNVMWDYYPMKRKPKK